MSATDAEPLHLQRRRAIKLVDLGRLDAAERLAKEIIRSNPEDSYAWGVLALVSEGRSDFEEMRDRARTALGFHPDYEWALRLLSISEHHLGRREEAIAALEAAASVAPESWLVHTMLAEILTERADQRDQARTAVGRALELAPCEVYPHRVAGRLALADGRREDGVAAFRRGLQINPDDAECLSALGVALLVGRRPSRLAECAVLYTRASANAPDWSTPVRNLDHVLHFMAYSVARFSLVAAFVVAVASGTSGRPGIIATTALAFALIGTFAARFTCRASSPVRRRLWRHLTQREAFLFPAYAQLAVCGFLLAATVVPRDLSQLMACAAGVSAVGALVLYTRAERRLGLNRRYNNHSQRRSVSQVTRVAVFMFFAAAACIPFPSTRLAGIVFTAAFGFIAWSWYVRPTLARRRRATRSDT